ncbi:MAG: glycosyltransferase [Anaerolineales bacterium]|nr:glycosyltransferase [Anaerolineales bacterium]
MHNSEQTSEIESNNHQVEDFPLVSIITPSFNQGQFLGATIRSVLDQDYPRIEYIVVDGGSTDGSVDILKGYSDDLSKWISEPDAGQTDAINKGFSIATGRIFAWINSDDLYKPGAVADAVAYLQAHPEVGMVYGDADFVNDDGDWIGRFHSAETDYRKLRQGYVHIPQQATFFRSSLWKLVCPLDTTFYFAMDYDLWVRIAALTPIRHVQRTWASFRLHGEAKSMASADRCWPEMLRVHKRLGGSQLSVIYVKYLIRRLLEPVLPYRLYARLWLQRWAMGREG